MSVTYNMPVQEQEPVALSDFQQRLMSYIQSGRESVASQKMFQVAQHLEQLKIRTALDIGSWHLKQTLEMVHAFPDCLVHAFEPAPDNFDLCRRTHASMNPAERSRVKVWNVACGSTNGPVDFYVIDETLGDRNAGAASKFKFKPGMNGSFYNQRWEQKHVQVQQLKLDDWQTKYEVGPVDLIWIDVQGGELDAFRGAERMLNDVHIIFTEVGLQAYYEGQSLKPQIDEFLASKGFREIVDAFELNGFEYEGNTVYVRA